MNNKSLKRFIILCLSPALILFSVFMIYPTFSVFLMSLYKWGGLSSNKLFVGLNNFKILMQDENFIRSFQNTVFLIVVVTIVTLVIAIMFAAILVKENVKGQNFFRVIFYIPNILSVVVISSIFSAIYDPGQGLINSFLSLINGDGFKSIQFLGNQDIVIYSIAGAMIWQAIGYYMVIYMAGMSSIPNQLYESADIEGASKVRQFFKITLPLVWDTIRTSLIFFIISSINLSFLFVKIMTSGGPDGASEVFLSYMYKQAYNNASYGYGMSIGVIVFIFSFLLSGVINKITKRDTLQY
ncbi:carbohydrate ABC transporter permease [Senegalia massiliensis]|uniref:Sugar ABC transporter permease n=1 Tax=Senegalia massiliensis TaxID=1720316 RepID=A0A845QYW3_9CLOT|nr:sugar ABC transporter permease [Senegalia massiliensis]NBI07350.1 sugar ABC transporter permease [Senegalia massiliensis]